VSQALIDVLRAAGHRVIVVGYRRSGESMRPHRDDLIPAERPIETQGAAGHAATWLARAVLTGLPYSVAKYVSRDYRRAVIEVSKQHVDLVVVDHAQSGWTLRAITEGDSSVPLVYVAHNVEHELYREQAENHSGLRRYVYAREARRIRALEAKLLSEARQAWVLSEKDGNAAMALAPAVDIRPLAPPPAVARTTATATTDVVLLGKWSWAANAVGLEWFLERVVPGLPSGTRVHVAGAGAERYRAAHPRVTFDGAVEDATRFLASGRAIAVPVQAGAGVQIKTLDAIATGRPVVATSLALRGLDDVPPTIERADDPVEFANRLANALVRAPSTTDSEAVDAWIGRRRQRFERDVRAALDDVLANR
jgi:hypothetical protein